MWIARDKDNTLQLFKTKPSRHQLLSNGTLLDEFWDEETVFDGSKFVYLGESFEIDQSLFPTLKWEDEPIEVELTIKNK